MPLLMLKDVPRYECLLKAAEQTPGMDLEATFSFMNLLRTADMVFAEKGRFLAREKMSQGRFTVLMLLKNGCCEATPAALAEEAGVTRATMTGLLDTLEKDGFVTRQPDASDRRIFRILLTERGRDHAVQLEPGWLKFVSRIMSPLTSEERGTLVALLQKIQLGLTTADPSEKV